MNKGVIALEATGKVKGTILNQFSWMNMKIILG